VSVLVYHPFDPVTRPSCQIECWRQLAALPPEWELVNQLCVSSFDYSAGLAEVWDGDHDLIIVEHDNSPTPVMLAEMVACREPVCTRPYQIGPASSHQLVTFPSVRNGPSLPRVGEMIPTATHSSIGCTKYSPAWRAMVGRPERQLWYHVENSLNRLVAGNPGAWHVHWPMCGHGH